MPANKKYLTSSKWQRLAKITAGLVGGFILSGSIHTAIAAWWSRPEVIITSSFTLCLVWAGLMILAFLAKNGWKVWGLYLFVTLIFAGITFWGKTQIL